MGGPAEARGAHVVDGEARELIVDDVRHHFEPEQGYLGKNSEKDKANYKNT